MVFRVHHAQTVHERIESKLRFLTGKGIEIDVEEGIAHGCEHAAHLCQGTADLHA